MDHKCPHEPHAHDPYHHACKDCKEQKCDHQHLALYVAKALIEDGDAFMARTAPSNLEFLGVREGDFILVEGTRRALVPVGPVLPLREAEGVLHLDDATMRNTGASIFRKVNVRIPVTRPADEIILEPAGPMLLKAEHMEQWTRLLQGFVLLEGNGIPLSVRPDRRELFLVRSTRPEGPVIVTPGTHVRFEPKARAPGMEQEGVTYQDIGGLRREIDRIREVVELPLKYPEIFTRLGVEPPKGILLYGPPGSGKTLIGRAVAQETQAAFHHLNGPEIMQRHYGESEENLRSFFEKAQNNAPAILFLDEIDAVAPRREKTEGEVEKRVVAQLLALMDGLKSRGQVVVIGATNIPNALDPALRRPGRFDREIAIGVPNETGRLEILRIHSRNMPLSPRVDLEEWARRTHGFVGADLKALCQEAAFQALRRTLPEPAWKDVCVPPGLLDTLFVEPDDFEDALKEVEPSAIREVHVELPQVGWDHVGGCSQAKRTLQEMVIWPLRFPGWFEKACVTPPKGLLITGPPGTGKTLLARALARESGLNFISVKGPELLSKYVGESEERIREIFHKARMAAPSILFFDEIDSIAGHRGADAGSARVTSRMVSQILAEMDGVESLKGVVILGATNRPELLDPSLTRPGRFEVHVILGLPDENERREIFRIHLKGKTLGEQVDLDRLVRRTEGWSGARIEALCRGALMEWIREEIQESKDHPEECVLQERHFLKALDCLVG